MIHTACDITQPHPNSPDEVKTQQLSKGRAAIADGKHVLAEIRKEENDERLRTNQQQTMAKRQGY